LSNGVGALLNKIFTRAVEGRCHLQDASVFNELKVDLTLLGEVMQ